MLCPPAYLVLSTERIKWWWLPSPRPPFTYAHDRHQTPSQCWNTPYSQTWRPSHGHGMRVKTWWRSVQRFQRYARGQTDTQTDWSQYSAPQPGRSKILSDMERLVDYWNQ